MKISQRLLKAAVKQSAKAKPKVRAGQSTPARGKLVRTSRVTSVSIGAVSVKVHAPTARQVQESVRTSAVILSRLVKRLATPGVRLKKEKGVPWFTADLHDPAIVTRELNGIKQRGRFVGGVFRTEKSN